MQFYNPPNYDSLIQVGKTEDWVRVLAGSRPKKERKLKLGILNTGVEGKK
jgi:hypothetical protein